MRRPDFDRVSALDRRLARERPVDHAQNLRTVEALRREAITLGVWPPDDPLAGLDADIRLARLLNRLNRSLPEPPH